MYIYFFQINLILLTYNLFTIILIFTQSKKTISLEYACHIHVQEQPPSSDISLASYHAPIDRFQSKGFILLNLLYLEGYKN